MRIRAAVVNHRGGPFEFGDVDLDAPQPHEVVVRVAASGLCHTDLHARDGKLPVGFPSIFGHEGAGVIVAVGASVTRVAEGDHVVMVAPSCGQCANCKRGRRAYCLELPGLKMDGTRADGSMTTRLADKPIRSAFFQQSSFATYAIATELNVVRVPRDLDLSIAAALPCGVSTGAGVVATVVRPEPGSSFAVIGAGAVGLAALLAARDAGCQPLVAVDLHSNRLRVAQQLGASHTILGADGDLGAALRELTAGVGVDAAIDTTGSPDVARHGFDGIAAQGTYCIVGTPPQGAELSLPMGVVLNGRSVRGSIQGDGRPHAFIPELIDRYRAGRFPIDSLLSYYDFSELNRAARDMEAGIAIKPVLRIGPTRVHEGPMVV